MNSEKELLIASLDDEKLPNIVQEYLLSFPYDTDIIVLNSYIMYLNNDLDKAYDTLNVIIDYIPFDVDAYFTMGIILHAMNNNYEALKCLKRAFIMHGYYSENNLIYNDKICIELIKKLFDLLIVDAENRADINLLKLLNYNEHNGWNVVGDHIRSDGPVQGEFLYYEDEIKYCGFTDPINSLIFGNLGLSNLQCAKGEIISNARLCQKFDINYDGDKVAVPVASEKSKNPIKFFSNGKLYKTIVQCDPKRFAYFTINKNTTIESDDPIIVGNPIKLRNEGNRKKLVICLFVDGFSQKVISQVGLQNVMPKTYEFFSKGMICNNVYSTSDWTYPSIASCCTGMYPSSHMMLHPSINTSIRNETIFESFKNAGYHTTLINGDWRMDDAYGYLRGVDRCIVKHQNIDMNTNTVLELAIDNIEAFRETDHFMWLSTGDLHSICDEIELDTSVQMKTSIEDWPEFEISENSVRQKYNTSKQRLYYLVTEQIDRRLNALYEFLESNYKDEDYSIVLFGDHGHAYFIPENEHHMSDWLTNVAFMSRGGKQGVTDDYFSLKDMRSVLFALSGINVDESSESNLPVCYGGAKNDEFVISENIHPGEPVRISLHSEKYTAYFTTKNDVNDHCRVEDGDYELNVFDKEGQIITDNNLISKYQEVIMNRLKYILSY